MKGIICCSLVSTLSAAMALNCIISSAETFHNGGTGECSGCHTSPPALKFSDPASTCLGCHQAPLGSYLPEEHYVSTQENGAPLCLQLSPGGDFCWLKRSYRWHPSGMGLQSDVISAGERHGHNIVAVDFGYESDSVHRTAPGGNYPARHLSCISCHDPHGRYRRLVDGSIGTVGPPIISSGSYTGSPSPGIDGVVGVYRLLGGKGYALKSLSGLYAFVADPPAAVSPAPYNRAETLFDTRVAYGKGVSEWCSNCHNLIHNDEAQGPSRHPVGDGARLSREIINNYNSYIASGNLKGSSNNSYTSLVPFEIGTGDYALLKSIAGSNGSNRSGPQGDASVMCLTCHRAHASVWDSMTRWNTGTEFIVFNGHYPGIDNDAPQEYAQGRTESEARKAFYDRPAGSFAPYQRSLCNKCHGKD